MSYPEFKTETYVCTGGINTKASPYVTAPNEFQDLVNVNFVQPGALTKRAGTDEYLGATVSGRLTSGVQFERLSGESFIIGSANTNLYSINTSAFTPIRANLLDGGLFDFVPFVNRLWCANGQDFFKTDGVDSSNYGLPAPTGYSVYPGFTTGAGFTGTFVAAPGYFNDRGYFGPPAAGTTISLNGATFNVIAYAGLTIAPGFGISGIQLYRSSMDGVDLFETRTLPGSAIVAGATFLDVGALSANSAPTGIYFTLAPSYIELFNNQLFMAGFSGALSTAVWSDIGEPESIQADYNAEFRTNDGDRITGMKAYQGSLIVTKQRSFHRVSGEDPTNFQLLEISDQYGCLSNRALVSWEDMLWFLDPKGIVQYDGANVKVVSNKIEPLFMRMNVSAAINNACGGHVRDRNEVWFAIPLDDSTVNNCIIVFDYVSNAWTRYEGVDVSCLFQATTATLPISPFFGGYTGTLNYFGASLYGDSGQGITCRILTRFQADGGQTEERQYRQFWLNVSPIGVTQSIEINLRSNYGTSIQVSRTMYQSPYQSRIDFGIPARSIQAEILHVSATLPFQLPGYSFASRFQRST